MTSSTFRTLIAMVAKFDLKTIQMNAVNVLFNSKLDEVVYIRILPVIPLVFAIVKVPRAN